MFVVQDMLENILGTVYNELHSISILSGYTTIYMTWPPGRQSWSEAQPWTPSPHSDPGTRWGLLYYIWNVLSWGSLSFIRPFFKLLFPFEKDLLNYLWCPSLHPFLRKKKLNYLYCLINHQRNHQPSPCDPLDVLLDPLEPIRQPIWPPGTP